MKKRILIINTGGTISSKKTARGYEPISGYVQTALQEITALSHPQMPEYCIKEYSPLLDSSNISLEEWNQIAADIETEYDNFDGFVIFHGTDTMAYTACALSFMLENLAKPVILTGSQIPLSEARNDALDNIITSLWLCAHYDIYEVCVYFNQQLFRGNRVRKVSAQGLRAFISPNYPELAIVGVNITLTKHLLLPKPNQSLRRQALTPQFIANFRLFPGFSNAVLSHILTQPQIKGLVLETYGAGNAPNDDPIFLENLATACNQGIVIVNCSQCPQGRVAMEDYATGNSLKKIGIISGYDITPEAALCKLIYLFSNNQNSDYVKQAFDTNLCGEISIN